MSASVIEKQDRTIYHACKHAVRAVDDKLKFERVVLRALTLERQRYVDLANDIAAQNDLESIT